MYTILFIISVLAVSADCADFTTFVIWHVFWGIIMLITGLKIVEKVEEE